MIRSIVVWYFLAIFHRGILRRQGQPHNGRLGVQYAALDCQTPEITSCPEHFVTNACSARVACTSASRLFFIWKERDFREYCSST